MATYYSTTTGWEVVAWFFIIYDLIWIPIVSYHLYLYYLYRNHSFFKPRVSKVTIIFVVLLIINLLHRAVDALIGIGILANNWIIGTLYAYVQLFPLFAAYLYKFGILFFCLFCVFHSIMITYISNSILSIYSNLIDVGLHFINIVEVKL